MFHTLPRSAGRRQTAPDAAGCLPLSRPGPGLPSRAQVAAAAGRCLALEKLREFRQRLYECLAARADAQFDLIDAMLCADHAVTSLVQLSLEPEFRRGHGALYDGLAAGKIDEEKLGALLAAALPHLVGGDEGAAWAAEHDTIDYALLERALARVPAGEAARVREACARWTRLRIAVDATPYPRPDAECSPGRDHVHHDACRCDGTRKTIPGWEYQFAAVPGQLRTAWAALIDVARTTAGTRTDQTIAQVKNVLRRLHAAGNTGGGAPLFIFDAGYSAAALTAGLLGCPAHVLVRLPAGSVFYADPVTWPGKKGKPGTAAWRSMPSGPRTTPPPKPATAPAAARSPCRPAPSRTRNSPCRAPRCTAPSASGPGAACTPLVHGDRGWFSDHWHGPLPVLRGTLIHVTVERLPDGRAPHKAVWLWHAGPAPLSLDELWRAYPARFDVEHAFRFAKGTLGLTAAKVRTPEQAGRWAWLVMAAYAQLQLARPLAPDLRRKWEPRPGPGRPLPPGRVRRGFINIRPDLGTPARVAKSTRPGPGRPKGSTKGPAPRYPVPKKTGQNDNTGPQARQEKG